MHVYQVSVNMTEENKGKVSVPDASPFEVSAPPEFDGAPGVWSQEQLFVASAASCLMTTLFYFVRKKKLKISSYESRASGTMEKTGRGLLFTSITVNATLCFTDSESMERAGEDFGRLAEKYCLVSNSMNLPVTFHLETTLE